MNEKLQNKQIILKELEILLSENKTSSMQEDKEMFIYCNYMKRFFLSCSTNN